jgi:hypothetical protein
MTFPAIIFGLLVACLIGSVFHFWRGGSLVRLILYLVLSIVGFWAGQIVGDLIGLRFWSVGSINLGACLLSCIIFLGVGYWLSLVKPADAARKGSKRK